MRPLLVPALVVLSPLAFPQVLSQRVEPLDGPFAPFEGGIVDARVDVEASGVLRRVGLLCVAFETDAGELYALADRGGFEPGERVQVRGRFVGAVACGNLITSLLDNTIEPAFAGTGTLVADVGPFLALETPAGARYRVFNRSVFVEGETVFVRGPVRTPRDPRTGAVVHWIVNGAIGTAFTGFGRLDGGAGAWTGELDGGGRLALDGPGYAFATAGDYVFVEGRLDLATDPPTLRDNTARRALAVPGEVVDAGGGVPAFRAETLVFADLFALEDLGGFTIGDRVFVRGRRLDDYDPLEVRGPLVRDARLDPEFTGCGTLVTSLAADFGGRGTGAVFRAESGEAFRLESLGTVTTEPFVLVTGALDRTGARFLHNRLVPCLELSGTLRFGFECTPVFVADNGPQGNSVLLLENLGPYTVGDSFCVRGGLAPCEVGCPVPCLIANTTGDCTQ